MSLNIRMEGDSHETELEAEPFIFDVLKFSKNEAYEWAEKHISYVVSASSSESSKWASSDSTTTEVLSRKSLMRRKRNLMSLLRSYPMRITYDDDMFKSYEGLIPADIIRGGEKDKRSSSIFNDLVPIPKAILNLAVDLAVQQLIHTLTSIHKKEYQYQYSHPVKYIRLSTRNDVEKRAVMEKIEAALNDKQQKLQVLNSFHGTLSINASKSLAWTENQFRQHICQLLQLSLIEDNDFLLTRRINEEMSLNKYLVLVVDRDGGESIDPWKVGFSRSSFAGVLVLITTESKTQPKKNKLMAELIDLEIWTRDHLLSWNVFCHNVGRKFVYLSSAILTTAIRIVEECRGHLVAIVLIAKWLLKNTQDVKHWELALHKMLYTDPSYEIQTHLSTIMKNIFLNLIWDSLNKAQKHCLLRCLFIPEIIYGRVDHELLNDWITSLFVDVEETKQILTQLLDISVLLQSKAFGDRYIQLPEETYEILQSIYTLNPLVVNMSRLGLTELLDTYQWQNALQIDLANNKVSELPLSPKWPELKILMLQCNIDLTKIPSSFFVDMPQLQILNLSYTSLRELPQSLFFLEQLRELYLKGCESLMKLPPEIGNLQKLEKLDLDETQITHLPKEVQKLTYLQSLTLYFYEYRSKKSKAYSCSTIIPNGVFSKLKKLKHLSIGVNPDDERWHDNVQLILPEILELKLLQTLSIYIPQLELLKLIPAHILEEVDFRFIVGCHMQRIMSSIPPEIDVKFKESGCSLKFVKGDNISVEVKKLVRHSKALFLDRHSTIKNLSEFEMENLQQLRVCILAECKEMQTIVGGSSNGDMLSHLLFLSVSHMKNLRSIWEGPTFPRVLFGMLQSLSLLSCPKLTTLFSLDFLGNLSLLKDLLVKDCPKLSTLIKINHESSSQRNSLTFLPKLRKLSLLYLPELTSISNGLHIGPYLEEIAFYDCPKLLELSKNELSSNELVAIKGETNWWNAVKGRTSIFDMIFFPIHEEADVITQMALYKVYDVNNAPALFPEKSICWTLPKHANGREGKPSQPTSVSSRMDRMSYRKKREIYSSSLEDGYTWSKYGEKEILGSKYPRSYYICIHNFNQGCQATKQIQRDDENPSFKITYFGYHTCNVQPMKNLDKKSFAYPS